MVKISSIFGLGILVAFTPWFLNFPLPWKNIIYMVSGIMIAVLSVMIRKELESVVKHLHTEVIKEDTFTESSPKTQEDK